MLTPEEEEEQQMRKTYAWISWFCQLITVRHVEVALMFRLLLKGFLLFTLQVFQLFFLLSVELVVEAIEVRMLAQLSTGEALLRIHHQATLERQECGILDRTPVTGITFMKSKLRSETYGNFCSNGSMVSGSGMCTFL